MSYVEALEKMFENFKALSSSKTVVGEPIEIGGKTIIPLIQALMGFGGGGGEGELKEGFLKKNKGDSAGNFSGFGGGIKVSPVGVIVIDEHGISFIHVDKGGGVFDKLVDTIPQVLDRFMPQKESGESE